MIMVTTLNGKITKGNNPDIYKPRISPRLERGLVARRSPAFKWTSREDQKYFSSLLKKNNLMVMGSETYEAARKNIKLDSNQLRIILTRDPGRYKANAVPGKLEFSNESPQQLVKRLENKGFKQMLLLGGGTINTLFLKESLVDELYLTLEPKIFGKGKTLVREGKFEILLELIKIKRLNQSGTLLLKYKILS